MSKSRLQHKGAVFATILLSGPATHAAGATPMPTPTVRASLTFTVVGAHTFHWQASELPSPSGLKQTQQRPGRDRVLTPAPSPPWDRHGQAAAALSGVRAFCTGN
jgi:hypothetical protein